jgi:O-antigen ligase
MLKHAMANHPMADQFIRGLAYGLMAISLTAAALLTGGVYPGQWEWIALGVSFAALGAVWLRSTSGPVRQDRWSFLLMALLLAWMVLQLVPLPPILIWLLSPERWDAVAAARAATGQSNRAWFALSAAPAATMERLLQVVPVMAAFVAAGEIGWWWRNRLWGAVAPVLFVAWMESLIGLGRSHPAGTYVNRNHFAGLLEMALPLASVWAVSVWRSWKMRDDPPVWGVVLLGIAACLWTALIMSLSRMGVVSALAALLVTTVMLLASQPEKRRRIPGAHLTWRRVAVLPMLLLVFVPTRAMVQRFFDVNSTGDQSGNIRVHIWKDTTHVVAAYKWMGTGLGAYEQGLYRHRAVEPASTVDFAHNDYLQILTELGLVGCVLFGALALRVVWRTFSVAMRIRNGNWAVALALMGSFVALGLHSITDFNLYIPANALALAWLAGVADSPGLTEV